MRRCDYVVPNVRTVSGYLECLRAVLRRSKAASRLQPDFVR